MLLATLGSDKWRIAYSAFGFILLEDKAAGEILTGSISNRP